MRKRLISQIDKRWRNDARYDKRVVDALAELDDTIYDLLEKPSKGNKKTAVFAQKRFNQAMETFIARGALQKGSYSYPIKNYGCWDCCMCMVISDFQQRLFEYGRRQGLSVTPLHFLKVMRSWQILSCLGYQDEVVIDPVSVVTKGRVQLVLHEDYGKHGVSLADAPLLHFALRHRKVISIAACVKGHAMLGNKPSTHWIVLDPIGPTLEQGMMMRDPLKTEKTRCSYRKLYTLCLYSTPRQARRLLSQPR